MGDFIRNFIHGVLYPFMPTGGNIRAANYMAGKITSSILGPRKLQATAYSKASAFSNYYVQYKLSCDKLYASGNYEECIVLAIEANSILPPQEFPVFNYLIGLSYFNLSTQYYKEGRTNRAKNELEKAKHVFEEIRNYKDKRTEVHYFLGLISERQGKNKKAAKEYSRALRYEADFKPAKDRLKVVQP